MFDKALNESINGIGNAELVECCGSLKGTQLTVSNVQKAYVNMIGKAQRSMEDAFEKVCELQKVEDVIRRSMAADGESSSFSVAQAEMAEKQFNALVAEEKERETERLSAAIQQLDADVKRHRDLLQRLKSQVQNEIAAASKECQKMALAVSHIQSTGAQE